MLDADLLQRLEGEIGVHRLGAVARQHAEMVHLARLAGLDDEAGLHAQALADQVVVHRRGGQRRRDRDAVGPGGAVGQDQDVDVGQHRLGRLAAHLLQRRLQARRRPSSAGQVMSMRGGAEGAVEQLVDRADLLQVVVGQDRLGDLEPLVRAGVVAEQVRPRPDHRDQAHHQLLADRVDRRVGDLGEVLLEVVVEQLRAASREHRDRRVGAHRADRVVAGHGHRLEEELQVLLGVAERLLAIEQASGSFGRSGLVGAIAVRSSSLNWVSPSHSS